MALEVSEGDAIFLFHVRFVEISSRRNTYASFLRSLWLCTSSRGNTTPFLRRAHFTSLRRPRSSFAKKKKSVNTPADRRWICRISKVSVTQSSKARTRDEISPILQLYILHVKIFRPDPDGKIRCEAGDNFFLYFVKMKPAFRSFG